MIDHEPELERCRKRRRHLRLHGPHCDRTRRDARQHVAQPGHVKGILQYVAVRLHHDWKRWILAHGLEQIARLQALQPQRHAPPWVAAWEQQGSRGIHAKARPEQRRRPHLLQHQPLGFLHRERPDGIQRRKRAHVGKAQHQPVVRRLDLHLNTEPFSNATPECHSPRGVHAPAERCVKHHAHRTHLIAEVLEHEVRVVGHDVRGRSLRLHVLHQ